MLKEKQNYPKKKEKDLLT